MLTLTTNKMLLLIQSNDPYSSSLNSSILWLNSSIHSNNLKRNIQDGQIFGRNKRVQPPTSHVPYPHYEFLMQFCLDAQINKFVIFLLFWQNQSINFHTFKELQTHNLAIDLFGRKVAHIDCLQPPKYKFKANRQQIPNQTNFGFWGFFGEWKDWKVGHKHNWKGDFYGLHCTKDLFNK